MKFKLYLVFLGTCLLVWPTSSMASLSWSKFPDSLKYTSANVDRKTKVSMLKSVAAATQPFFLRLIDSKEIKQALLADILVVSDDGGKLIFGLVGAQVPRLNKNKLYRVKNGGLVYHFAIGGQPVALAFLGFNTQEIERMVVGLSGNSKVGYREFPSRNIALAIESLLSQRALAEEVRNETSRPNGGPQEAASGDSTVNYLAQSFMGCYVLGGISAANLTVVEPVRMAKNEILAVPERVSKISNNLSYAYNHPRQYWENSIEHFKAIWAQAQDLDKIIAEKWNSYWRKPVAERNRILCSILPAVEGAYVKFATGMGGNLERLAARRQMETEVAKRQAGKATEVASAPETAANKPGALRAAAVPEEATVGKGMKGEHEAGSTQSATEVGKRPNSELNAPQRVVETASVEASPGEISAAKLGDVALAYSAELGEIGPGVKEVLDKITELEAQGLSRERIKQLIKDGELKCPAN